MLKNFLMSTVVKGQLISSRYKRQEKSSERFVFAFIVDPGEMGPYRQAMDSLEYLH